MWSKKSKLVLEDRAREGRLRQLLKQYKEGDPIILIFALYKKEAERIEYSLKREGTTSARFMEIRINQLANPLCPTSRMGIRCVELPLRLSQ